MNQKLLAGLAAAAVLAPACAVCILGPAVIVSIFAGLAAWFGGFDATVTAGLVLAVGIAVYGFFRKRGAQRTPAVPTGEVSR